MTDTQILTTAMSTAPTILIVLVGIVINNARLGALSTILNSRLNDMHHASEKPISELVNFARIWTCASRK